MVETSGRLVKPGVRRVGVQGSSQELSCRVFAMARYTLRHAFSMCDDPGESASAAMRSTVTSRVRALSICASWAKSESYAFAQLRVLEIRTVLFDRDVERLTSLKHLSELTLDQCELSHAGFRTLGQIGDTARAETVVWGRAGEYGSFVGT